MHEGGNLQMLAVLPIDAVDRIPNILIEGWDGSVQNVSDKEQNVLQFVRNRHLLRRVFICLPTRCREQPDILQGGVVFLGRHRRV